MLSRDFAHEFGVTFPVLIDDAGYPVSNAYGLTSVPTYFSDQSRRQGASRQRRFRQSGNRSDRRRACGSKEYYTLAGFPYRRSGSRPQTRLRLQKLGPVGPNRNRIVDTVGVPARYSKFPSTLLMLFWFLPLIFDHTGRTRFCRYVSCQPSRFVPLSSGFFFFRIRALPFTDDCHRTAIQSSCRGSDSSFLHVGRVNSPYVKNHWLRFLPCALRSLSWLRQSRGTGIQFPCSCPTVVCSAQVPGNPREINNLATAAAVSPDGHFVVFLHSGFGDYKAEPRAIALGFES